MRLAPRNSDYDFESALILQLANHGLDLNRIVAIMHRSPAVLRHFLDQYPVGTSRDALSDKERVIAY